MRLRTLHRRNLTFHLRMNLAVGLSVIAATAALAGALVVGDSMRTSLRDIAVARLAGADYALRSQRFFSRSLADRLADSVAFANGVEKITPLMILRAGCDHADTGARVGRVSLIGVDADAPLGGDFGLLLNEPLARELGVGIGDDVLLRVGKPSAVATETLLGRRDDRVRSIRRTVRGTLPAEGLGALELDPRHQSPRNAYLPLATLQRLLDQKTRINTILVTVRRDTDAPTASDLLRDALRDQWRLDDVGLRVRVDDEHGYVSLESDQFLLEPPVERGARVAFESASPDADTGSLLTYLANDIAIEGRGDGHVIPYSTVTALDTDALSAVHFTLTDGTVVESLQSGDILLNEWAADDLGARVGDTIDLGYYVTESFGVLETRRATFSLRGIVRLTGGADDPGFTPEYPGVSDTENIADWDPPFPVNLSLVRDTDEQYWDDHRATPKAFVSLGDGLRLWGEDADRFGRLTAMRLYATDDTRPAALATEFEASIRRHLDVGAMGLRFEPVRERALSAGRGSTDFGGLFIGFSFFLILAAALLVALMFRLGVEQRASEVGLLLAVGFSPSRVTRILVVDGLLVAGIGAAIGLIVSVVYASLMLTGLKTWWSDAVNAPFLTLSVSPISLAIGYVASVMVAGASIYVSIRGLTRSSPRSLVAGVVQSGRRDSASSNHLSLKRIAISAGAASLVFAVLPMTGDVIPDAFAFFGSGAFMLVALLTALNHWLRTERRAVIRQGGRGAWVRLGLRNVPRRAGRSLLTVSLIASATFVVTALQAFRVDVNPEGSREKNSGTGGFTLLAETTVPLLFDLNTRSGQASLNVSAIGDDVRVCAFRLRDGDDSSCLNLYLPTKPRIIGAPDSMIERGGFVFASTLAETEAERANPWRLLERTFADGAIPAIGDEAAVKWQHHLGLGKDLVLTDEHGGERRLRFVALLKGSALQNELVVSERQFVEMFPSIGGYGFFLIDTPLTAIETTANALERDLQPFGFDATPSADRLTEYLAVQNTYLSTFQSLGGLGLVLGTIGLAAVLLRNVSERRGELALMRAVGFSQAAIRWMVLTENTALVCAGLFAGLLPAMVAVFPHITHDPMSLPWPSIAGTVSAVAVVGTFSGLFALSSALRAPLLTALRTE